MRQIAVALTVLTVAGLFAVGCGDNGPSKAEEILGGEHKLRKMAERTDVNSRVSASFFLFVGDVSATTKTSVSVKFAWEMNDGTCALSSLPLEKIRIKLDESAATPTIKFRWRPWNLFSTPQVDSLMNNYVRYAVVTAKESDWPIQINLPLFIKLGQRKMLLFPPRYATLLYE